MRSATLSWTTRGGWSGEADQDARLVLYFAAPSALAAARPWEELARRHPGATIVGCSTGGEIAGRDVQDDSVVAVAMTPERSSCAAVSCELDGDSEDAGRRLAEALPRDGLRGVLVLSDGTLVNGSALVRGLKSVLADDVVITGGLAGDGADFGSTRVGLNGEPRPGTLVAVGFYGDRVEVGHGSFGGWEQFGPERMVTRAAGNVLYELDGEPALDLYRRYLGDEAAQLPGSALLYPLRIRESARSETDLVRTVVGIDEAEKAMIFAGDVPQGWVAQLMRGNFDRLIAGAGRAAEQTASGSDGVAILISCIGRKLLLGPRTAEEVEAVADVLGDGCRTVGFYSYGEISPHGFTKTCELHNQTMTITVIRER